jgi:hypothetical protein
MTKVAGTSKRGARPGERRGGRAKGTPNKDTRSVMERLQALGHDPITGMAMIAMGMGGCRNCRNTGKKDGVTCEVCGGTKHEPLDPALRGRMDAELAQYVYPKRKAIEHSGAEDAPPVGIRVIVVGKDGPPYPPLKAGDL